MTESEASNPRLIGPHQQRYDILTRSLIETDGGDM
jgi:hypothetical protein